MTYNNVLYTLTSFKILILEVECDTRNVELERFVISVPMF